MEKEKTPVGFIEVETQSLVKASWNYKDNDEVILEKLIKNIRKNGVIENLIVRELPTGFLEVINGNHRYDAIVKLNIARVYVYNLGRISDSRAKRVAIETNETSFPTDLIRMGNLLREMTTEFEVPDLLETLPFNEKQLDKLMKLDNWPTIQEGAKGKESDEDLISVKMVFTFEQHERWAEWKTLCGTDNDIEALFRAIENSDLSNTTQP